MTETIALPRQLVTRLLEHAQSSPESEVCGLISRDKNNQLRCYRIANQSKQPATRFSMDGQQQIAAMLKMRENDESLFAIYHSHPTAAAEPSATDLAEAAYPEALYLIISLNTKGVLEMRGFNLQPNNQQVNEVTLVLEGLED